LNEEKHLGENHQKLVDPAAYVGGGEEKVRNVAHTEP
jgi:hypothetical protein